MEWILTTTHPQGVLEVKLNRPEKYNALNDDLLSALAHLLDEIKHDHSVNAVLLTGAGKAFCAGADITQLAKADANTGRAFAEKGQTVFRQLETLGKPSLAAVHGVALGGGCELAMAATIRLASTEAKFAQPEVKLGVIPGYGGTVRLPRLIGKGRAMELCLTGRTIDATTALAYGLVTDVTEPDALIPSALALLTGLASGPSAAIAAIMQTIDHGYDIPMHEAQAYEALQFAMTCTTADKQEGISAYLEKRPAQFRKITG